MAVTPSGLQFLDLVAGHGPQPTKGRTCEVHYTGWIWERGRKGLVFDTTQGGDPLAFKLGKGQVIPGWEEGIASMKVGGKRRLLVPPGLGYGDRGTPDGTIPPGATLCFEVELVAVR